MGPGVMAATVDTAPMVSNAQRRVEGSLKVDQMLSDARKHMASSEVRGCRNPVEPGPKCATARHAM